jgi:hypothetical protein
VRRVVIAPHVQDYAIRVTLATHPSGIFAIPIVNQFLRGRRPAQEPRKPSRSPPRSARSWMVVST